MITSLARTLILLSLQQWLSRYGRVTAFSIHKPLSTCITTGTHTLRSSPLFAGGFQWEDPVESDQGVENPFKNPNLLKDHDGNLKIDPGRLLSPRLNGVNLYFIGMMGR